MVINHLVLSGGGVVGLVQYGILKQLTKMNIINYKNIKSIYATSIGSYIGLIYLLNYKWEWMDDFLIKRQLDKLVSNKLNLYDFFFKKGIINEELIRIIIRPLLLGKDLDENITLKQLYDINKIKFNIYVSNITLFKKEVLNYLTTPDMSIIKAITISMSVPILFQPNYYNNNLYLDGGIFINTPLNECYLNEKCDKENILVLFNDSRICIDMSNCFYLENNYNFSCQEKSSCESSSNSNILEYVLMLIKILFNKIQYIENENTISIDNVINIALQPSSVDIKYWNYVLKNESERIYLIDLGINQADCFINKKSNYMLDDIIISSIDIKKIINDNSNTIIDNSNIIFDNSNIIIDNSDIKIIQFL